MPIFPAHEAVKIFRVVIEGMKIAQMVRDSNPVRRNQQGNFVCRYCDGAVTGTPEIPIFDHASDCPYAAAQELR